MKLKSFKQFLNEFELEGEHQQSKPLWNGKDYLDRDGDINLSDMNLTELPCVFPEKWDKSFYCGGNKLISLMGSPREIGGEFGASGNNLTSLKGAPKVIKGNFYCKNNPLITLEGIPNEVHGMFTISNIQKSISFTESDIRKLCKVRGGVYV
jgi:hypothetical protein